MRFNPKLLVAPWTVLRMGAFCAEHLNSNASGNALVDMLTDRRFNLADIVSAKASANAVKKQL